MAECALKFEQLMPAAARNTNSQTATRTSAGWTQRLSLICRQWCDQCAFISLTISSTFMEDG